MTARSHTAATTPGNFLRPAGAIASVFFVALGLFEIWNLNLLGTGLSICILALVAAPSLSLGLYVFSLRDRIAALENQLRQPE
jgi:hypothetical protein